MSSTGTRRTVLTYIESHWNICILMLCTVMLITQQETQDTQAGSKLVSMHVHIQYYICTYVEV